jgi:hypothetical protein
MNPICLIASITKAKKIDYIELKIFCTEKETTEQG